MLELLKVHLDECFAVEEATLIEQAIEEMAKMNVDSDAFYSNLFMEWEQGLVENINSEIRAAVVTDAANVLTAHGITLVEDAKLSDIVVFLRFFASVEDFEMQDMLYGIVTNDEYDDVEKLCTAIEEVTGEDCTNLMAVIDHVGNAVITNMASYCQQRMLEAPIDISEETESRELGEMLKHYALHIQGQDMACYKHVFEANASVGLPIELYWKTYHNYLSTIPREAMLYELVGFAMISDQSDKNPADVIAPILTMHFGDDIDQIAMAKTVINQIVIDLRNTLGSGVFVQRPE